LKTPASARADPAVVETRVELAARETWGDPHSWLCLRKRTLWEVSRSGSFKDITTQVP